MLPHTLTVNCFLSIGSQPFPLLWELGFRIPEWLRFKLRWLFQIPVNFHRTRKFGGQLLASSWYLPHHPHWIDGRNGHDWKVHWRDLDPSLLRAIHSKQADAWQQAELYRCWSWTKWMIYPTPKTAAPWLPVAVPRWDGSCWHILVISCNNDNRDAAV